MRTSALRAATLAAAVTVLLPLTACSESGTTDDPDGPPRSPVAANAAEASSSGELASQKLTWKPCPAPSPAQGGGKTPSPLPGGTPWECSFMKVPLDYANPGGETIELALIRARAKNPDKRIGSLIFNFGGPGASGVATLPAFGNDYDKLRAGYDLVSFDPRGVGRSAGVECETDQQLDARYETDVTPDDSAEVNAFVKDIKTFALACKKNSGRELPYVGTINAARDMDLMRQVLGDKKLYYFGISYGTELGGVYANLFPKNVGRSVLDGVVDPTLDSVQSSLGQAKGFQLALDNFAEDCVNRGAACKLPGSTGKEVEQGISGLLTRLEKNPIPGLGTRQLTQSLAITGIAASLYSKETWPLLEQGVDEADGGNGALLLALADSLNGREADGHYDNSMAANTAINCADSKQRFTADQTMAKLPEFQSASPVFGDYLGWGLMACTGWPVAGVWETPDVSAPGAAPILVIGNTGDPATPYKGAKSMADALGKGVGVELTYEGQGHGAYNSGNACVQKVVGDYLLNGKVPAAGTVCK
ncbi:alpha/beta hydrolase [Streptomyces atratus]|uniref:alpha/beta hydrolase n=1 Tax=Streptomyces atratus TaxID=1893 RepID=UPI00166FD695|nr:alpha/beta hydrolase [Streptomyces atratus]WPW31259.1 alpha/beta hydrolase [Streptomyces atratus]GGT08115.1 peptidase [Streptomyces atratus]